MREKKGPRDFDDAMNLIEEANAKQRQFVCEGDAAERRATEFYCAKLRATKRILSACGKAEIWERPDVKIPDILTGKERLGIMFHLKDGHKIARAVLAYRKLLVRWERAERRRAAFEMGEGLIAQGLGRIPALNAGRKAIEAGKTKARKLGLRIKP